MESLGYILIEERLGIYPPSFQEGLEKLALSTSPGERETETQ